ncbi:MAG: CRTAC1 family protein [Myxococcota bacterium]
MSVTVPIVLALAACTGDSSGTTPTPVDPHTGDTAEIPAPSADWEVLPSRGCAAPDARDTLGPFATFDAGDWGDQPVDMGAMHFILGSGAAVGDLNGDGWNDIVIPRRIGVELYLNDGAGGFVEAPLPAVGRGGVGAAVVDFDGDGDLDVYLSQYGYHDILLANDGHARFRDVTERAGIGEHPYGVGSSWADMDGDGDLDLLALEHGNWVTVRSERSHVYENLGGGRFVEVIGALPDETAYGHTLAGGWMDLDADLDPDVYLVNDYGWILQNHLLWNDGGTLTPAVPGHGLGLRVCGMGLAETDLNDDGVPDLFLSSWLELALLESVAPGVWANQTLVSGLSVQGDLNRHVAWGADFGDVDNDGDDDLFIGFGHIYANLDNPFFQPDALYEQQSGTFTEVSATWGLADPAITRGAMLVDLDGDGWLDLLKRNRWAPATIRPARCGEAAWLEVQLANPTSPNTRGVGARVRVVARGIEAEVAHTQARVIRAGGRSLASGGPPEVHFGLAGFEAVDVEVTWPDGAVQTVPDVPTRQRIRIVRDAAIAPSTPRGGP